MLGRSDGQSARGAAHPGRSRGVARRLALASVYVSLGALAGPAAGAPPHEPPGPPDAAGAGSPFADVELVLESGTYTYFSCRGIQGVHDLAVGEGGEAILAGFFPWDCDRGFPDYFARKLAPEGAVQSFASAQGGGQDVANGVALDAEGNIYITGTTSSGTAGRRNFTVVDPYQPVNGGGDFTFDAFVVKLDPEAETILYATFLGGTGTDVGTDIAVDEEGRIVVVGTTDSVDFPTESPLQGGLAGGRDVFITVFEPDGSELAFSTYFGGVEDERAGRLALLRDRIFFTGTTSSPDLPTRAPGRPGVLDDEYGGVSDAFVARIDRHRRLGYAGFLGGSDKDVGGDLEVDRSGSVFVTGTTVSADFPTLRAAQDGLAEPSVADAFLTRLAPSGARARYSTYLDLEGSAECEAGKLGLGLGLSSMFCTAVDVADDGTAFLTGKGFFAIAVSNNGRRILGAVEGFGGTGIEVTDAGVIVAGSTPTFRLPLENIPGPGLRHIFEQVGWLVRLSRRSGAGSGPP